jgi:uncharacterized protein (TIGR03066 family)
MKMLRLIPCGCLCLMLAACSQSPSPSASAPSSGLKEQIVGKWQEGKDSDEAVMEFGKDGSMTVSMGPINMKGKFTMENDGTVITEMESPFDPAKTTVVKLKAALVKDELTLTNEDEKDPAKRVKKFKRK